MSAPAWTDTEPALATYESIFHQLRSLGQMLAPVALLPVLAAHTHTMRVLADRVGPTHRTTALLMAARFAEYTGWISQEAGDDTAALWWTELASTLATTAGDRDFGPYALVRRALVALYQGDSVNTVAPAQHAQSADCSARVRGLAAQREAQGWAIGGDYGRCRRALDRAEALLSTRPTDEQVIGSWTVRDPVALTTGWCLYDLGRPAESAEVLSRELAAVPPQAVRARARYGARLALAYAGANEVEQACAVAGTVLDAMTMVDSATVRTDVLELNRTLGRRSRNAVVRELMPRLAAALTVPSLTR